MEEYEGADILETSSVSNGPWCKVRTFIPPLPSVTENIIFLLFTGDFSKPLALDQTECNLCISFVNNFRNSLEQGCAKH